MPEINEPSAVPLICATLTRIEQFWLPGDDGKERLVEQRVWMAAKGHELQVSNFARGPNEKLAIQTKVVGWRGKIKGFGPNGYTVYRPNQTTPLEAYYSSSEIWVHPGYTETLDSSATYFKGVEVLRDRHLRRSSHGGDFSEHLIVDGDGNVLAQESNRSQGPRAYVAREWQPDFKSGARLDSFRAEIERDRQARNTAPAKINFILRYAGQSIPAQDLEKIQKLPGVRIIESTSKMLLVAGDEAALKDLVADLKDWRMSPEVPVAQADQPPEVEQIRKLPGVLGVEVHVKDGLILVSFQNKASYDAAVRQGLSLPRKLGRYDVAYSAAGVLISE